MPAVTFSMHSTVQNVFDAAAESSCRHAINLAEPTPSQFGTSLRVVLFVLTSENCVLQSSVN